MTKPPIFLDVFNHLNNGIAVVNLETLLIEQINPAFHEMLEENDPLEGKSFSYLMSLIIGENNLENNLKGILLSVISGEQFVGDVVFYKKKKKEKKFLRLNIKPVDAKRFLLDIQDLSEFEKNKLRMNKTINEAKLTSKLLSIASQNLDKQGILETVCKELANAFNMKRLALYVLENKEDSFEVVAEQMDNDKGSSILGQRFELNNLVESFGQRKRQPVIIEDVQSSLLLSPEFKDILIEHQTATFLAMPLSMKEKIIGLLILDISEKHEFTQDEVYLVIHIAGTTGLILDMARLYEEINNELAQRKIAERTLQASEDAMLAIYNITSSHILSYSEKVQAMLSLGCQLFNMDIGILTHLKDGRPDIKEIYSENFDAVKDEIYIINHHLCDSIYTSKEPLLINLDNPGPSLKIDNGRDYSVYAYLGVVVKVHGNSDGALVFFSSLSHFAPLNPTDRELIRLMAQWIGTETEREEFLFRLKSDSNEIENKNIELTDSRNQALELARLKSEFLATVSHEIRTPMNAIIGMTDLLIRTDLNREQREYAKVVNDSGQLLLKLINDILDFSKIEAGKIVLEKIDFDLENAVETAVDLFINKSHEKGLDIVVYLNNDLPKFVSGDLLRFQQILMNLLANAIKFTETGGIIIKADIKEEAEDSINICFYVKDTGIGISQEALSRLFQPFSQADGSTTRKYGGTGLGLAISKKLVEMMGGEIGLESVENQGSTFWFNVEFGRSNDNSTLSSNIQKMENIHALVIEKKNICREYYCQFLKDWGIEAYGVKTYEDMAKLLKADATFELLVLDMSDQSKMDMYKFNQITKGIEGFQLIKKIFIHSLEQKVTKEFSDFNILYRLIKPVKRIPFYEMVKNVMTGDIPNPEVLTEAEDSPQIFQLSNPFVDIVQGENQAGSGDQVLLAEDNPSNQKLAVLQLEKLGYRCTVVSDGAQAVEAIKNEPEKYKFALMDSQMPELDGLSATMQIRDFEFTRGQHIPIIAMTGNATDEDRVNCIKAGMDGYITKPVTVELLSETIQKVFPNENPLRKIKAFSGPLTGRLFPAETLVTVDKSVIDSIRELQIEGEPDVLTELIDLYVTDSKEMVKNIRTAWEKRDGVNLKRWAHSLKGASSNIGAKKLGSLLAELENQAANGKFTEAKTNIANIELEYLNVHQALEKERAD